MAINHFENDLQVFERLKSQGFRRRNNSWAKKSGHAVQTVNFQMRLGSLTVNISVHYPSDRTSRMIWLETRLVDQPDGSDRWWDPEDPATAADIVARLDAWGFRWLDERSEPGFAARELRAGSWAGNPPAEVVLYLLAGESEEARAVVPAALEYARTKLRDDPGERAFWEALADEARQMLLAAGIGEGLEDG